ncbi:rhomboid family intramembrane serine protease [Alloacidobacterium dinghuense]|uniref:Rhomboid family intramembrane serine protease n=1 Tax=Alloacidobacterium dinghuense TaxID=2763107 RepID=A0A7G8BH92_9BACT|nr:rhomboid family intramembrane serine protease [Alloacidobacterium dinghuense]QNI31912.1 rhomboid family intramembrane serine protease [Alloacidobacterium dinghuense]
MPRSAGILNFPDFRGFTRRLILWNVGAYFLLLILGLVAAPLAADVVRFGALIPPLFLHGYLWQLITYSFLHQGILGTALEMLSLWFLGSFLESNHGPRWLAELFFTSVVGAGLTAVGLSLVMRADAFSAFAIMGCFGGIFGLLVAFGVLYGNMEFMLFPLPMTMKAKYLVIVYMLIAVAMVFSASRVYALGQLGGALAGYLYIKAAPRRGYAIATSERYFGLRNNFYRWKRRRAAKKFEVYMRKQNRDVHFDKEGRYTGSEKDPNDRRWMN